QDVILDPARRRACDDYCGDLSGRYLESVALTRLLGRPVDWDKAQRVARTVLDAQRADGSFGPDRPAATTDHGVAWGNGRLLTGLITFADAAEGTLRADVQGAAERLVDSLVTAMPGWLDWFSDPQNQRLKFSLDFLSTLDPLIEWCRRTGDEKALAAARSAAAVIPEPDGDFHMHGYLLALRGWLELAAIDGDAAAMQTIAEWWRRVRAGWMLPHGGVLESLKLPRDINTECCGIADWIMLTLRLSALRSDEHLLDVAELSLYNALPHTQRGSGHYGCETLCADPGLLTFDYPPEAWWCCTFHGLRALYDAARAAVRPVAGGLQVDLYIDSAGVVDGVSYDLRTEYPRSGAVTLTVGSPTTVRLRLPGTSRLAGLTVDGAKLEGRSSGGFVAVAVEQTISVELERAVWISSGQVRFLTPTANCTDETGPLHGRRGAIFHGPMLLGADAAHNDLENVLRSRRAEIQVAGDSFGLAPGDDSGIFRAEGLGFAGRFPLVLAPLADQVNYGRDVSTRIEFDEISAVTG
ncbi:MAG TPA: hypothetical protein VHW44_23115, partial [Pseudonocardiaceae bacterium]|nr:hypothetical protein [Pseudonocardiaceae bacterium]